MLYETLRAGMASDGDMSVARFIASLDRKPSDLHEQYVGEVMIGSMFGAVLCIERSTSKWMAEQIVTGLVAEFLNHLKEQGARPSQIEEWQRIVSEHFAEYRRCLCDYEGLEPPWKLGRQFYWNITGVEEYIAMSIKIATYYILAAQDAAQKIVNEYGPTVVVNLTT